MASKVHPTSNLGHIITKIVYLRKSNFLELKKNPFLISHYNGTLGGDTSKDCTKQCHSQWRTQKFAEGVRGKKQKAKTTMEIEKYLHITYRLLNFKRSLDDEMS